MKLTEWKKAATSTPCLLIKDKSKLLECFLVKSSENYGVKYAVNTCNNL